MKIGVRTPSIKKSIKARTTGRMKRQLKKSVNPLYGKKGMGWVNNPNKAVYNKVYNKTTVGVSDLTNGSSSCSNSNSTKRYSSEAPISAYKSSTENYLVAAVVLMVAAIVLFLLGLVLRLLFPVFGTIFAAIGILLFLLGIGCIRKAKSITEKYSQ